MLPDDVRARFARTDFILDMYESGVYDREEAGEKLFDHLFGKGAYGNGFRGLKPIPVFRFFGIHRFRYPVG